MTLEECYRQLGGDYAEVQSRIPGEMLVKKFIRAFLSDPSYAELNDAMNLKNRADAFRAAHTLKGVCANLGFETLRTSAGALTEILRPAVETIPQAAFPLWQSVRNDYRNTIDVISAFFEEA